MSKKKEQPINLQEVPEEEKLKYEIAEELGLLDKVLETGWKSLSAKETGRIGGLMTKRRREEKEVKVKRKPPVVPADGPYTGSPRLRPLFQILPDYPTQ